MTNYNIKKVTDYEAAQRERYFIDANVWIAVLKGVASLQPSNYEMPYVEFFDSIIQLNLLEDRRGLKALKKQGKFQPKIVMTSMLMSEIFNAYMRNVAMKLYYSKEELKRNDYKRNYRNTPDHDKQLKRLKDEFLAFYDYMEIKDDEFSKNDPKLICSQLKSDSDFNDQYYYYLLTDSNIPIVTGDRDFIFQDIEIITNNNELLKLKS